MLVSKINRVEHIGWDNNSGGFKRVCHQIFSLAHRDAYRSAYSCALFAAFCETSKRLENVWFFGGCSLNQRQRRDSQPLTAKHTGGATLDIVPQTGRE